MILESQTQTKKHKETKKLFYFFSFLFFLFVFVIQELLRMLEGSGGHENQGFMTREIPE
jgi:hypothetical protein